MSWLGHMGTYVCVEHQRSARARRYDYRSNPPHCPVCGEAMKVIAYGSIPRRGDKGAWNELKLVEQR